jgi:hypothetical protein
MASPAIPKNRQIEATDQSTKLLFDVLGEHRDCPIMIPATNAPSSVCTPMKFVISARQWRSKNHADNGHLDNKVVVGPANDFRDPMTPNRKAKREKSHRAQDAEKHWSNDNSSLGGKAANKRENCPAHGVIQNRGREDDLAEIAAEIVHFPEDGRDDLDGGNRESRREKKRGEQAPVWIGNVVRGSASQTP